MTYLTPEEYGAKRLPRPVKGDTIRKWCREGLIEHVKDGRRIMIPESELSKRLDFEGVAEKRRERAAQAEIRLIGKLKPDEKAAVVEGIQDLLKRLRLSDRVAVEA